MSIEIRIHAADIEQRDRATRAIAEAVPSAHRVTDNNNEADKNIITGAEVAMLVLGSAGAVSASIVANAIYDILKSILGSKRELEKRELETTTIIEDAVSGLKITITETSREIPD